MAVSGVDLAVAFGINGAVAVAFLIAFCFLRIAPATRRFYAPKRYDPEVVTRPRRLGKRFTAWAAPVIAAPESEVVSVAGLDAAVFLRLLIYGARLFGFVTVWCCGLLIPINATAGGIAAAGALAPSDLDLLSVANVPASGTPGHARLWAHLVSCYVVSLASLGLLWSFSSDVSTLRARFLSTVPRSATTHSVLVTDIPCVGKKSLIPGALRRAASGALSVSRRASEQLSTTMLRGTSFPTPNPAATSLASTAAAPSGLGAPSTAATAGAASPAADVNRTAVPLPPLAPEVLNPTLCAERHLAAGCSVESLVEGEMRSTYGAAHVAAITCAYDTSGVEPLAAKYESSKSRLADLVDDYIGKMRRHIVIKKRTMVTLLPGLAPAWARERFSVGAGPVKVDALDYLPLELQHLREQIRAQAATAASTPLPAAFVTFGDRFTQTLASTGLHSHDELCWRVQAAPGPDEIVRSNLRLRHPTRVTRTLLMWAAFAALLIFYLPVVAAVQAVVNMENVRNIPGLGKVVDIPFVTQVLKGVLPSIVLKIFLALLPTLLNAMHRFEGAVSLSAIDFGTVSKFYIFQVVSVFLFSFIAGSALSQLSAILDNPESLVPLLGVAAPQQAGFFMSYILVSACAVGIQLVRPVPLIIYAIKTRLAGTEKARYRLWAKQTHTFGTEVAGHSLVLLLGLSFCCVAPLIAPFCLVYFITALVAQRYQLLYVLSRPYDAGGKMWKNIFNQIMTGIYFLQAVTIAVLAVKRFPFAALLLPLIIATAAFHGAALRLFARPWALTALREAAALDARDGAATLTDAERAALQRLYLSPALTVDDTEHEELIANAAMVDAKLRGNGVGDVAVKDMVMRQDSPEEAMLV